ncbi:hypothetical protein ACX93W_12480 [Paenibacillus sp. CAU 1782]
MITRNPDGPENFAAIDSGHGPEKARLCEETRPVFGVKDRNAGDVSDDYEAETVLTVISGFHIEIPPISLIVSVTLIKQ